MPRFVVAPTRASLRSAAPRSFDELASVAASLGGHLIASPSTNSAGETAVLVEADAEEIQARSRTLRDFIVEPEIQHVLESQIESQAGGEAIVELRVVVMGGAPLVGARLALEVIDPHGDALQHERQTDLDGQAVFSLPSGSEPRALVACPLSGYWPMAVVSPPGAVRIECLNLPHADNSLGWWHTAMGLRQHQPDRGSGVRIGVVDTGVGPHPCLDHVHPEWAFINGSAGGSSSPDVDLHGTHVCGIIGARPRNPHDFAGLAPAAKLYVARTFAKGGDANQADLANAIRHLAQNTSADIINLSLSAGVRSQILIDAIEDARDLGCLCVCAAGNSGCPVRWPARHSTVISVGAIGRVGWAPEGSHSALSDARESQDEREGSFFAPSFSCFASSTARLDCCAPGVGIISTSPGGHGAPPGFLALDGTSMATPMVSAAAAAHLQASPVLRTMPRSSTRTDTLKHTVLNSCFDLGLNPRNQGRGVPIFP